MGTKLTIIPLLEAELLEPIEYSYGAGQPIDWLDTEFEEWLEEKEDKMADLMILALIHGEQ